MAAAAVKAAAVKAAAVTAEAGPAEDQVDLGGAPGAVLCGAARFAPSA